MKSSSVGERALKLARGTVLVLGIGILIVMAFAIGNSISQRSEDASEVEWGVRIEVMLEGGGTAILVCPKFPSKPAGAHGRECYIEEYDYSIESQIAED